jgi:hypothetical protein
MVSTTSRMNRLFGVRRVRRTFATPLLTAVVGLFLTAAQAPAKSARRDDAASGIEKISAAFQAGSARAHVLTSSVDAQRRATPPVYDALPTSPRVSIAALRAQIACGVRRDAPRTTDVARGYDATAPPLSRLT